MSAWRKTVVGWAALLLGCTPATRVERGGADDPADPRAAVGGVAPASRTLEVGGATPPVMPLMPLMPHLLNSGPLTRPAPGPEAGPEAGPAGDGGHHHGR